MSGTLRWTYKWIRQFLVSTCSRVLALAYHLHLNVIFHNTSSYTNLWMPELFRETSPARDDVTTYYIPITSGSGIDSQTTTLSDYGVTLSVSHSLTPLRDVRISSCVRHGRLRDNKILSMQALSRISIVPQSTTYDTESSSRHHTMGKPSRGGCLGAVSENRDLYLRESRVPFGHVINISH